MPFFIWIPLDVDTGIVEKVRRQVRLGDAFAPSLAALLIGLGGVLLILKRSSSDELETRASTDAMPTTVLLSETSTEPRAVVADESERLLHRSDFIHAFVVLTIASLSLFLMRYLGPFVLQLVDGSEAEHRLLRDTFPWKYIGFAAGGIILIVSLISYIA